MAGANDLGQDERYTGQRRVESGGIWPNKELYHYGARWFLPGPGIFSQPDTIVPEPKNPQALNRLSYAYNNPVKYNDPSGHGPGDPLTVTPAPTSTPGPSGTSVPPGPVVPESTVVPSSSTVAVPVPAPTPAPMWVPPQNSVPASSGAAIPSFAALFQRSLIDTFGNSMMAAAPTAWGMGRRMNNALGLLLGELGSGQRSLGPDGILVYENVQGVTRALVKDVLGGGVDNAVTIGNVILNSAVFDPTQPRGARWIAHEHAHVGQAGALGPAYLPTYLVLWFTSGQNHDAHPMEALANDYRDYYWQSYVEQPGGIP